MSALQDLSLVMEKLDKVSIVLQEANSDSPPPLSHSELGQWWEGGKEGSSQVYKIDGNTLSLRKIEIYF